MRKCRPVIILLSVQLAFAIALALVTPVTDFIVRTKGTEHTLDVSEVWTIGESRISCRIKHRSDYDWTEYHPENYALIETDENGISYISELSEARPEAGEYIGTKKKPFHWYEYFEAKTEQELLMKAFSLDPPMFYGEDLTVHPDYKFTVKVHIYKGMALLDDVYVNGVELEEFFENI